MIWHLSPLRNHVLSTKFSPSCKLLKEFSSLVYRVCIHEGKNIAVVNVEVIKKCLNELDKNKFPLDEMGDVAELFEVMIS
jgi:glutathionylspermidine synthase